MTTIEVIRFVLSCCCTLAGLIAIVSAVFGVFRFHHALSRVHAAALIDTVGMLMMLVGVMIGLGWTLTTLKLAVIIIFLWITSPVSSHLITRLEVTTNDHLQDELKLDAPEMVRNEKEVK